MRCERMQRDCQWEYVVFIYTVQPILSCLSKCVYSVCGCVWYPWESTTSESQKPIQIQSHSLWINYENNNFSSYRCVAMPPYSSARLPDHFLHPYPLIFFILLPLYCMCGGSRWLVVIREVKCEYVSITTAVLHHAELVIFLKNAISLCVAYVHCVSCDIALPRGTFEVTPVHKACLSQHAMHV